MRKRTPRAAILTIVGGSTGAWSGYSSHLVAAASFCGMQFGEANLASRIVYTPPPGLVGTRPGRAIFGTLIRILGAEPEHLRHRSAPPPK